jgi:SAM-dependent methyltransferase
MASKAQSRAGLKNLKIVDGDILELSAYPGRFDVIITERVLINLPSWDLQKHAIEQIWQALKPGGLYLLLENTHDANDVVNAYRERVGLPAIPIHWHNHFLHIDEFKKFIDGKFDLIERKGFNLYYFLSRVYSQMFASFTGSGRAARKDPIFESADKAARLLQELVGDEIEFKANPVFGPIQAFALKRI